MNCRPLLGESCRFRREVDKQYEGDHGGSIYPQRVGGQMRLSVNGCRTDRESWTGGVRWKLDGGLWYMSGEQMTNKWTVVTGWIGGCGLLPGSAEGRELATG